MASIVRNGDAVKEMTLQHRQKWRCWIARYSQSFTHCCRRVSFLGAGFGSLHGAEARS